MTTNRCHFYCRHFYIIPRIFYILTMMWWFLYIIPRMLSFFCIKNTNRMFTKSTNMFSPFLCEEYILMGGQSIKIYSLCRKRVLSRTNYIYTMKIPTIYWCRVESSQYIGFGPHVSQNQINEYKI
jgi:hypothetical protein